MHGQGTIDFDRGFNLPSFNLEVTWPPSFEETLRDLDKVIRDLQEAFARECDRRIAADIIRKLCERRDLVRPLRSPAFTAPIPFRARLLSRDSKPNPLPRRHARQAVPSRTRRRRRVWER